MAYVFQTNLLAPDAAFSVPQQEAIADEDALDLVLSISDTHSGGTTAAAGDAAARVSADKWQLNQLMKNIRVAFEDQQADTLDTTNGLIACDYDQANTKLNVQRWILDMCGASSVDVVLGNAPGTTTGVDLSPGHEVAAKGDFADTLEGGADGTVAPGTNTKDNDKKRVGGSYDFIDALSTAISFAWVKGTDALPGGAATTADHATANGATDLWERTLRFRNQIVQDRIRTDVLSACAPATSNLGNGASGSNSYLMSQVVQCGTHDTIEDTFPVASSAGTAGVLQQTGIRASSGQGWVIELGRRIVGHSMRRAQQAGSGDDGAGADVVDPPGGTGGTDLARRHVTYGGHDSGALIDNAPVSTAAGAHGSSGGSMWIKGAYDAANATTGTDGAAAGSALHSKCNLVNAPYDSKSTPPAKAPVSSAATITLKKADGTTAAFNLDPADGTNYDDAVCGSAKYKLGTDQAHAVYEPNEVRMRPCMQENDQLCLSMQIKVRNSQDGQGSSAAERTAKVGFLFRQMATGAIVPQVSSTGAAGTDLLSGVLNSNYQSGCTQAGFSAADDLAYINNTASDKFPAENVTQ